MTDMKALAQRLRDVDFPEPPPELLEAIRGSRERTPISVKVKALAVGDVWAEAQAYRNVEARRHLEDDMRWVKHRIKRVKAATELIKAGRPIPQGFYRGNQMALLTFENAPSGDSVAAALIGNILGQNYLTRLPDEAYDEESPVFEVEDEDYSKKGGAVTLIAHYAGVSRQTASRWLDFWQSNEWWDKLHEDYDYHNVFYYLEEVSDCLWSAVRP